MVGCLPERVLSADCVLHIRLGCLLLLLPGKSPKKVRERGGDIDRDRDRSPHFAEFPTARPGSLLPGLWVRRISAQNSDKQNMKIDCLGNATKNSAILYARYGRSGNAHSRDILRDPLQDRMCPKRDFRGGLSAEGGEEGGRQSMDDTLGDPTKFSGASEPRFNWRATST